MADNDREIAEIKLAIQSQMQAISLLQRQLQETRDIVEKLGKVGGVEYSEDIKDWVSKKKLDKLRKNPRDDDKAED